MPMDRRDAVKMCVCAEKREQKPKRARSTRVRGSAFVSALSRHESWILAGHPKQRVGKMKHL